MISTAALVVVAFSVATLGLSVPSNMTSESSARAVTFYDPAFRGGSMLDYAGEGGGEPLNIIISGQSSPYVLTDDGIVNYARAIGFSTECLGLHGGFVHTANLGDGHGSVKQTFVLREDYGSVPLGTCLQTLIGGNHFRVWHQNGPDANSGALFLGASKEMDLSQNHNIVPDGYNIGRDDVVRRAVGTKSFGGVSYVTVVQNTAGLLPAGAQGVNHGIATDGVTTILTVTTTRPVAHNDCAGSLLCPSLQVSQCNAARDKIVSTRMYGTSGEGAGTCSGHCGVFVQGTRCSFSGQYLIDAYAELRAGGCKKCGSKIYENGCFVTLNYVATCNNGRIASNAVEVSSFDRIEQS